MEETNPKDTTANPATGTNTAPAASQDVSVDNADVNKAASTIEEHVVLSASIVPVPPARKIQPISVIHSAQTPIKIPDPHQPIQSTPAPIPAIQNVHDEAKITPPVSDTPAPTATTPPAPKTLRADIANIIGKIKLPERITVKLSAGKAKPPAPPSPPPTIPPVPEKEIKNIGTVSAGDAPAQAALQSENVKREEKEPASSIVSVHTLKDDLQTVVRDKKMSIVRAVALETEKKRGQEHLADTNPASERARSRKAIGIAFVVVILLTLSTIAFVGVRFVLEQSAGNAVPAAAPALIFSEKTVVLPRETKTGADLKQTLLAGERNLENIQLGAIIRIVPTFSQTEPDGTETQRADSIGDFLTAIEARAAAELARSFRGDFFLGLHQTVDKLSPVIIIPVTSYERAFAGMLAWEPTMNSDLSPIFTPISPQIVNEQGVLVERHFQDSLINNYDVRVLKDDAGATKLLYSFPTRAILIISESQYSFTEALSRLRASRQL